MRLHKILSKGEDSATQDVQSLSEIQPISNEKSDWEVI